ncbi:MAG TPA: hypothetical protein VK211_10135 [Kamptonema sp.]|nr:hypothetical protein [Kamptonema sp.]
MNPIRLRLETTCFFWELSLGIRNDWDSCYIEQSQEKIATIDFHFYITLPSFYPDRQHIQWVKAAYGLNPQKSQKIVARRVLDTEEEYDPIPF